MSGSVRVGMSGFSYKAWRGNFYPEKIKPTDMLAFYATRFGAVEINSTFRRTPNASTLERWRDAVPEGFRFTLKAHQRITHGARLHHVSEPVDIFVRESRALGDQLGAILFQTPPNLAYDPDLVGRFFGLLPPVVPYAFEPRHPSFTDDGFTKSLEHFRVALCLNDELADPSTYPVTAPLAYFRCRRGDYDEAQWDALADAIRRIADAGTDVYVFFKHEDRPEAVGRALAFQERLG